MKQTVHSWRLAAAALCLPALLLAEVMPPLAEDVRGQLAVEGHQSVATPIVANALPVTSRGVPYSVMAEQLNLQSWEWASDANVFSLPSMALNSSASGFLAQRWQWTTNVTAANYGTATLDLLRVRFDNLSVVSPLGVAIKRASKDPSALAIAEALAAKAESRIKARKQK